MARDMTRRAHSAAELDTLAKITPNDVDHAAATFRHDARPPFRDYIDAPAYEGDGVPSDATRDP